MPLVRPAASSDLPAIAAIYRAAVLTSTATFETEPPTEEELGARLARVAAAGLPWLVAEQQGRVAGYAYAAPFHARPAYAWCVEDSVYIDPACHRQGIGRALLDEVMAGCTAAGIRQMIAAIGDSANAGSIGLHRAAGFAMAGTYREVGFKFGRWVDVILMQRALGDGGATPPQPRGPN